MNPLHDIILSELNAMPAKDAAELIYFFMGLAAAEGDIRAYVGLIKLMERYDLAWATRMREQTVTLLHDELGRWAELN